MKRRRGCVCLMFWFSLGWLSWYGFVSAASLPSPGIAISSPTATKPLPLSLKESIQLALQNNLDIFIESFVPKIQATDVIVEKSVFDPNFFLQSRLGRERKGNDAPQNFPPSGVSDDKIFEVEGRIEQRLPTGGRYIFRIRNDFLDSNELPPGRVVNPSYNQSIRLSLTQSLLRNLGIDINKTRIHVAQNNQRISESEFRQRVIDIVTRVQQIYWDLVFRIEDLGVQQQQLQLARDLLEKTRIQAEVGTLAPLDILQAEAEVAAIEDRVIIAQNAIAEANDRLKEILNLPETISDWALDIVPTDKPTYTMQEIDLEKAINTAFSQRPDYAQAKLAIENRNLNLRFRKNQLYPLLDLSGSVGLNNRLEDNVSDSFDSLFSGDFFSWEIGLTLQIPLGNREARNQWIRAKLEAEQALANLKRLEQQVIREVRDAVRNVNTNSKRINTTRLARELAEKKLAAEEKKLDVGLSTVINVVTVQRDLAIARRNEIQAIIEYTIALANLARVQGITLEEQNIEIDLSSYRSSLQPREREQQ